MNRGITEHAKKRMRQRGFSGHAMDIIVNYGRCEPAPGGAMKIFFGEKDYQMIASRLKKELQLLDNVKGGTVIVSEDGQILTIYKSK